MVLGLRLPAPGAAAAMGKKHKKHKTEWRSSYEGEAAALCDAPGHVRSAGPGAVRGVPGSRLRKVLARTEGSPRLARSSGAPQHVPQEGPETDTPLPAHTSGAWTGHKGVGWIWAVAERASGW